MRKYSILIALLVFSKVSFATLFQPISLKKHLLESSGIVQGEVVSQEAELDENSKIVTKVTLKASKWMGDFEIEGEEISVYFPGGEVGNRGRRIEGVPEFSLGETVVLLIQNRNDVDWVSNLGLGKYSVKRVGSEKVMVNQIFPTEPNMGQIPLEKFYELAKETKEMKFQYRFKEKYEVNNEYQNLPKSKANGRYIASVTQENESSSLDPFWLVILLGFLGVSVGVIRIKNS